jgi:hypothetical protein
MWWGLEDIFLLFLDRYGPYFRFQYRNHHFDLNLDRYSYSY